MPGCQDSSSASNGMSQLIGFFFKKKIRGRVDEAEAILLNINRVNGKEKEPEDLKSRLEYVSKSMREEKVHSHKSLFIFFWSPLLGP